MVANGIKRAMVKNMKLNQEQNLKKKETLAKNSRLYPVIPSHILDPRHNTRSAFWIAKFPDLFSTKPTFPPRIRTKTTSSKCGHYWHLGYWPQYILFFCNRILTNYFLQIKSTHLFLKPVVITTASLEIIRRQTSHISKSFKKKH